MRRCLLLLLIVVIVDSHEEKTTHHKEDSYAQPTEDKYAQPKKTQKVHRVQNQSIRDILEGVGQIICASGVNCSPGQRCPNNQEFGCGCEPTCANRNPSSCPRQCRCQCSRGFVHNSNNQCVDPRFCTQTCPANQVFRTCATACEPTCANRNPPCTRQCLSGRCQCTQGFVRNSNNQCIDPRFCPTQPGSCPANQVWNQCSTVCEPSCQTPNPTCQSFACGPPKCQCLANFYRQSSSTSACVPWWQCNRGPQPGQWSWWTSRPRG